MSVRRIILRRDTAFNWENSNPALRQGEIGIELPDADGTSDGTGARMKAGDGFTSWNELPYIDDAGLDILRQEYGDEISFELGFALTN